jgi:hypothetical protein
MEFVANNDALIAAFTFTISPSFINKAINKAARASSSGQISFVSIQSALPVMVTDLAMDEFTCIGRGADYKLQRIPSTRVRLVAPVFQLRFCVHILPTHFLFRYATPRQSASYSDGIRR